MLQKVEKPWLLIMSYVLLFVAMVALDQSTKLHAEKSYMNWSDPVDSRAYHSGSDRVHTWGVSRSLQTDLQREGQQNVEVSKNWVDFHVTYVRNHGAAWGAFSNMPEFFRLWGFYAITVLVSGFVLYLFKTTHPGNRIARSAFVFILAGAAGNFIDRLLLKYVIDWVHFHWNIFGWEYNFPVFNVADISINIGMGLMILDMIINGQKAESKKSKQASSDPSPPNSTTHPVA